MTGTFDNWSQSVKLEAKNQVHEKLVALPKTDRIFFKVGSSHRAARPKAKFARTRVHMPQHTGADTSLSAIPRLVLIR